jgi:hypothetical protein
MSYDPDQQLESQGAGQADWDEGLNQNFAILARGYHTVARVGHDVATADVLWMNSGGFLFKFDPNSLAIKPNALTFIGASSGESIQVLLSGIVRSLAAYVPGRDYYVSMTTPGLIVSSPSDKQIGHGVDGGGIYFNPRALVATSIDLSSLQVPTIVRSSVIIGATSWGINTQDFSALTPLVLVHSHGDVSTFYLQPASIAPLPNGTQIDGIMRGAGTITFAVTSSNVQLRAVNSMFKVNDQWSMWTLYKSAANLWILGGNITSVS